MRGFCATALVSGLSALLVFVLLFPYAGHDSNPPECFSVFGYVVPCGFGPEQDQGVGFALAGVVLAAGLVVVGSVVGRRESART